jgi:hypothetical protein
VFTFPHGEDLRHTVNIYNSLQFHPQVLNKGGCVLFTLIANGMLFMARRRAVKGFRMCHEQAMPVTQTYLCLSTMSELTINPQAMSISLALIHSVFLISLGICGPLEIQFFYSIPILITNLITHTSHSNLCNHMLCICIIYIYVIEWLQKG